MPATIHGYLEVDIKRGVIWFNSDEGKCVLRVCRLGEIPHDFDFIDVTHMVGRTITTTGTVEGMFQAANDFMTAFNDTLCDCGHAKGRHQLTNLGYYTRCSDCGCPEFNSASPAEGRSDERHDKR